MKASKPREEPAWAGALAERMRRHYQRFPYPKYSLLGSIRARDAWIFNLEALWARFRGRRIEDPAKEAILLAGSGSFLPYPVCVANPRGRVLALDLSASSLARARLHALRHLRLNLECVEGDLMDQSVAPGPFKYIDSYGVLHCIPDFAGALKALGSRLAEGGIVRVMVYSRDGRADVEEIRRRCAEAGITRPAEVRRLARGEAGLRGLMRESFELGFDEGIADAFLIPYARTFVVDEVLEALREAGLELLGFGHEGALGDPERETLRIRKLEAARAFPTNLCFYAGRPMAAPGPARWIELNPMLRNTVRFTAFGSPRLPPKIGAPVPPLGPEARRFLARFVHPLRADSLSAADRRSARAWARILVLMQYS